jgi:hypothetical protein
MLIAIAYSEPCSRPPIESSKFEMAESYLAHGTTESSSAERYQVMLHVSAVTLKSDKDPNDSEREITAVTPETPETERDHISHIENGPTFLLKSIFWAFESVNGSVRPQAVIGKARRNRRLCEERSDAAISNRLLSFGTEAAPLRREIATPFGLATTSVLGIAVQPIAHSTYRLRDERPPQAQSKVVFRHVADLGSVDAGGQQ